MFRDGKIVDDSKTIEDQLNETYADYGGFEKYFELIRSGMSYKQLYEYKKKLNEKLNKDSTTK